MKRKPKNPITKIRTGAGDLGKTFFKGEIIWKNTPEIIFLGDLDLACSALGKIYFDETLYDGWRVPNNPQLSYLKYSQKILFTIGGLCYTNLETFENNVIILDEYVKNVSEYMEFILANNNFIKLEGFIIPDKINADAMIARSLIRKCEISALNCISNWSIPALNAMSDYVFAVAWAQSVGEQWRGFKKNAH